MPLIVSSHLHLENKLCDLGALNNFVCSPSSRRPYPKRQNRKLPAHLADPNYINLDESERKSNEGVIENENVDGEDEEEGDDEKEISEDDPNK